ncbi:IS66-like element accessory protein TnpA [Burkholderia oklahomensis]|nr:transposase [Burkholderia oklahomensis]
MLIEACLEPGVSVASMAIRAQVNTNQLWRWIKAHKAEQQGGGVPGSELTAFVPAAEIRDPHAQAQPPQSTLPELPATEVPPPARLSARLPNGVTLELQCAGNDASLLVAMVKALGDGNVPLRHGPASLPAPRADRLPCRVEHAGDDGRAVDAA